MIILMLDDDADIRHTAVEKYLSKEHIVLHAFNCQEGLDLILQCQGKIGLALLDHDMADFLIEEDGMKIERHGAYFLHRMLNEIPEEKWPAQFLCHSGNPVGVDNMLSILRNRDQVVDAIRFSGEMLRNLAERIRPQ